MAGSENHLAPFDRFNDSYYAHEEGFDCEH